MGIRIQQTTYIEQQTTTVTTTPDTNDVPPSALVKNLKALDDINNVVSTVNESCSNELKPFFVQIQEITSNTRRKLLDYGLFVRLLWSEGLVVYGAMA